GLRKSLTAITDDSDLFLAYEIQVRIFVVINIHLIKSPFLDPVQVQGLMPLSANSSSARGVSSRVANLLIAICPVRVISVTPIGRNSSINVSTFSLLPEA